MTDGPTTPASASLIDRAKNILVAPKPEWARIAAESTTVGHLFTGYALILALIPLVAGIVGMLVFMPSFMRFTLSFVLATAVVGYVISMVVVFVMGLIISALAPSFGGVKDNVQGTKVAVYATTPVWVVGILQIFPPLSPLVYLAYLWVIFQIYLGLGPVMKAPEDKTIVYTLVIVLIYIVLMVVLTAVLAGIVLSMIGMTAITAAGALPTTY